MTTCAECLSTMSTSRVSDLEPGSAVALHCAACAECSRVAEEVRYAEHRLATALNEQRSRMDSSEVTVAAIKGSERLRRSRIARRVQIALIVAGCYVFFVFMEQRTKPDPRALDNLPAIPEGSAKNFCAPSMQSTNSTSSVSFRARVERNELLVRRRSRRLLPPPNQERIERRALPPILHVVGARDGKMEMRRCRVCVACRSHIA